MIFFNEKTNEYCIPPRLIELLVQKNPYLKIMMQKKKKKSTTSSQLPKSTHSFGVLVIAPPSAKGIKQR